MNQARSRAIDRHRFDRRHKRVDPHPDTPVAASGEGEANATLDAQQRDRRVHAAVSLLSADERQAIETAFFSELTHPDAAERLDWPLGTLKTRIRTGLAKLRLALAQEANEP